MSKEMIIIGAIILLIVFILIMTGCGGYKKLLREIPLLEFESFSYHRGGNVTSATITATGAKVEDGFVTIQDLHITADYGPFVNFDVQLKGYRREVGSQMSEVRGRKSEVRGQMSEIGVAKP